MKDWNYQKRKIIKACKAYRKSKKYIDRYICYAQKLYNQNLPIIMSPYHLSLLIGIDREYLNRMAYAPEKFYRHYDIPKKSGGLRHIDEPLPDLKYVQTWILKHILEKVPVSDYAKAFVKEKSIKENARFHKQQKVLVNLDIKDFFPSISTQDIVTIYKKLGYNDSLSCYLAYLCCYDFCLPQGAPTSPYLSNIRMAEVDSELSTYTKSRGYRYTRYADDITISGSFDPHYIIRFVSDVVYKNGFRLNTSKNYIARQNARQIVTGIVVNKRMQAPRELRKNIRKEVYYIKKFGINSHLDYIKETRQNYLYNLIGRISFVLWIDPNNREMMHYRDFIKSLM